MPKIHSTLVRKVAAVTTSFGLLMVAGVLSAAPGDKPWLPQREEPWLPTRVVFPCGENHQVGVPTVLPAGNALCEVLHMSVDGFYTTACPEVDPVAVNLDEVQESWLWGLQPSVYELGDLGSEDWVYEAVVTFYCIN